MRYKVPDQTAIDLSHSLYTNLMQTGQIDQALTQARRSLHLVHQDNHHWGTPILFLRADTGQLWAAGHPLPPGSRLPWAANPLFVGRENELEQLHQHLQAPNTVVINQAAVTGMGDRQDPVGGAICSPLRSSLSWRCFLVELCPTSKYCCRGGCLRGPAHLNLQPTFNSLPLAEQVALVQRAWQEPTPRLLIFDNCEDEELLTTRRCLQPPLKPRLLRTRKWW